VRESFSEYKKVLDLNLIGVKYLYDGDINFSTDDTYSEVKNSPLTSPSVMISCISKIYEESFSIMKSKSKEMTISEESLKGHFNNWNGLGGDQILRRIAKEMGGDPKYIFLSEKTQKLFELQFNKQSPFPTYFYPLGNTGHNFSTKILYSPFVEDIEDEIIIYAVDESIQSLVYSIQNMDYSVKMLDDSDLSNYKPYHEIEWVHTIDYKLYDCNFQSLKVRIKNVSKMRHDKINEILNE